jgi:hypothetical protein
LYGLRIRQPIGGDFGVSGDLVRHYLEAGDWTSDVSKFGIDIWMTTTALTGGFAVCQARLGAKVHDPKDPGADLGPMFRQVVTTILRLAVVHADRWKSVKGSHDVPAYGFERVADPPPLEVNVLRLLSEFHAGSLTMAAAWRSMLSSDTAERVLELAAEAGSVAEEARRRLELDVPGAVTPTTSAMTEASAAFRFPDDVWAHVIYDLIATARRDPAALDGYVAALVPVYFGRVASFVIEARDLPTERAEDGVERQAREFEHLKPYLLERWRSMGDGAGTAKATTARPASPKAPAAATAART